jgi:purine-nucleoside phosphorylase
MSALAYMRRRRLAAAVTGESVPDRVVRDERDAAPVVWPLTVPRTLDPCTVSGRPASTRPDPVRCLRSAPMTAPTPHLAARRGDIADAVLLPGDPRRAKAIAERFLSDAVLHNEVRGMLGYTGTYRGRRVSVQGTGMGIPSISIYTTELFRFYDVRTAIRVGSCGAYQDHVQLRDLIIATAAHTDSAINRRRFHGIDFAPAASFDLVAASHRLAVERGLPVHVGTVLSSDSFYDGDPAVTQALVAHGVLGTEMEASALYTIAAAHGGRALCLATVSDHVVRHETTTAAERETGFLAMAEVALETVLATD